MIITKFDTNIFLREYWQKQPCLIKQFVENFADPIDQDDLAGLAQEEGVDSRIVSNINGKWSVSQGPFDDFTKVCEGDWSLLVQGVDRYFDELTPLSDLVSFLPNWRFDDVMVSFSTANAGVGAHTDEYDVFIIQGQGSRRWQVGLPCNNKTILPHKLLQQIESFTPLIDEVLMPGDAIYIPPKHPHNGVALEPCMNYSLGFRAPTNLDVLSGILDENDSLQALASRYCDPTISKIRGNTLQGAQVSKNELQALKRSITDLLNTPAAEQSLLQYLSRQALPDLMPYEEITLQDMQQTLALGDTFVKAPGVKPVLHEIQVEKTIFFIDGQKFETSILLNQAVTKLISQPYCSGFPKEATSNQLKTAYARLMSELCNAGYWFAQAPLTERQD